MPGLKTGAVGAQQVCRQESIALVGAGTALAVAAAGALDDVGRDDVHLGVVARPEEIDHHPPRLPPSLYRVTIAYALHSSSNNCEGMAK